MVTGHLRVRSFALCRRFASIAVGSRVLDKEQHDRKQTARREQSCVRADRLCVVTWSS